MIQGIQRFALCAGVSAIVFAAMLLLLSPSVVLGALVGNHKCTGSASTCCPQADGCSSSSSGTSECPGSPHYAAQNHTGTSYKFCEAFWGNSCEYFTVQCCAIQWYSGSNCVAGPGNQLLCTTHLSQDGCNP